MAVWSRLGNCRETRRAKKRASSLFPRRESQIVEFLVGLVSDEKLERVFAKKPAHAQNKV